MVSEPLPLLPSITVPEISSSATMEAWPLVDDPAAILKFTLGMLGTILDGKNDIDGGNACYLCVVFPQIFNLVLCHQMCQEDHWQDWHLPQKGLVNFCNVLYKVYNSFRKTNFQKESVKKSPKQKELVKDG